MIFQDPKMTLNPVLRIGTQMRDALHAHERLGRRATRERSVAALGEVGLADPEARLRAYPHELSGGCASASPSQSRSCTAPTS
jgi:peptide/nickel transport system ATP-binding protein